MKILLKSIGCRLNEAELQSTACDFNKLGHSITNSIDDANIVIINSCAVTAEAERKSRKLIRKIYRDNPLIKVVVTGCYATLKPEEIAEKIGADLVIDNKNKDKIAAIVSEKLDIAAVSAHAAEANESTLFKRGMDRAFVKIQDGCRYSCAYCIVTVARGEERSRTTTEIINEINNLHNNGINEVVLTGVHIGGYGSDTNSNLPILITEILKNSNIPRIRLSSLEPWDLTPELLNLFKDRRMMPHLHLPIQSGSDTVLKRMRRRTDSTTFIKSLAMARNEIPDLEVSTDIIAGFPGETDTEWQQTLEFVKKCIFSTIHIFAFSPRAGTVAAEMPDKISPHIIKQRTEELAKLSEQIASESIEKYIGKTFPVLFEGKADNNRLSGYTPNFIRASVRTDTNTNLAGKIIDVEITGCDEGSLIGKT